MDPYAPLMEYIGPPLGNSHVSQNLGETSLLGVRFPCETSRREIRDFPTMA